MLQPITGMLPIPSIQAKTAEQFAAPSRIGAVVAERPQQLEEALDRFGCNLGSPFAGR